MSYKNASEGLKSYREAQIAGLLGESLGSWFTSGWDTIKDMLKAFSSDAENSVVAAGYTTEPGLSKAAAHLRLDYVCALRREVRKQYVSGDGDVCTDVTPFRHGVISAHGADIFDGLMETVIKYAEKQATGGG